jgi:hypothetical protein
MGHQLNSGIEGVRNIPMNLQGLCFALDKTATNREEDGAVNELIVFEGLETHSIGMLGQPLFALKH